MINKQIQPWKAGIIFLLSTAYFYLLLYILLPVLKKISFFHPALHWFIIGYLLFIPLFSFSLIRTKKEGNKSFRQILSALNIKLFSKKDWAYSIIGLLLIFICTGLIFGIALLLNKYFGIQMVSTTPWFMEFRPFVGIEKALLLVWLPMFFFNIVGEEILWRGYIQAKLQSKYSWLYCSVFWMIFHLPFGFDLIILALPALIIIPFTFYKTKNTLVGIFIHGVYNGPIFIAISLGLGSNQ